MIAHAYGILVQHEKWKLVALAERLLYGNTLVLPKTAPESSLRIVMLFASNVEKIAHSGETTKNNLCSKHCSTYDGLFATKVLENKQRSLDVFVRPVVVKKLSPHSDRAVQLTDAVADFLHVTPDQSVW